MSKDPLVSVLMPNYNGEHFLPQSIKSVLNQSFSDFEFIVVDDGSMDGSWEIIQKFSEEDGRLIAIRNEKNLRICQTLNRGLEKARGKYIARMDSDDVAHPDWLEKLVAFMEKEENKKVGVCGANFFIIDEKDNRTGKKVFPETDRECREAFWFRNPFAHNTVIIRRECFSEFGGYDEEFIYAEDLELWMRFAQKYELHNLQEFLVDYRIFGENSVIRKQKTMIDSTLKARRKAMKEYGYKMDLKGMIFYIGTWLMKWLPPKLVFQVFNWFKKNK